MISAVIFGVTENKMLWQSRELIMRTHDWQKSAKSFALSDPLLLLNDIHRSSVSRNAEHRSSSSLVSFGKDRERIGDVMIDVNFLIALNVSTFMIVKNMNASEIWNSEEGKCMLTFIIWDAKSSCSS